MWSPFGLFWSVKYLNFGQKLPIQTAHHTFLESWHPKVTENPYCVLSHQGSQKKISAHGLIPVCRGVHIHYFKINSPIFCCPLFSGNYLNPQVRIMELKILPKLTRLLVTSLYKFRQPSMQPLNFWFMFCCAII